MQLYTLIPRAKYEMSTMDEKLIFESFNNYCISSDKSGMIYIMFSVRWLMLSNLLVNRIQYLSL